MPMLMLDHFYITKKYMCSSDKKREETSINNGTPEGLWGY